ncbi:MAG: hypothetical protein HOQ02_04565 [Lysobacter sp.]|nr:hypothetical protein [Lysobacter sp.]
MSGELGAVFDMLERAFRISRADLGGSPAPEPEAKRAVRAAAQRLHDMAKDQGVTMTISGPGLQTVVINGQDEDPLLAKAEEIVRATRKPSISALQRVLKLGYNRAARLLEALEVRGVVSPPAPDGTRIVLPTTKEIA